MLFPTFDFLLFFVVVVVLLAALHRHHEPRKLVLVVASYVFYAQWNWRFCFLLASSTLWTYAAGLAMTATDAASWRRRIVAVAVAGHLALLGVFKYFDFFVGSLNDLAHHLGLAHELPFIEIILPVGISFFTFHGISYVVDVYRGDVPVCRRLTDMALYISFFPQLVAGPIVRASFFLPQLYRENPVPIAVGPPLLLIVGGLFKKVVVANYLATDLVDPVFFDPASFSTLDLLFAAYGYAVQIYCDFSAYSDMAIGLAALLGYWFPPNFDQPYRAQSVREFWHRWHISLSSWLRDYLYKPLGGSRDGRWRTARNLMITMLLGGIWHGAAWKFVFWGGLHGAGLTAERFLAPSGWGRSLAARVLATILVSHFVCLGWIFFRADSFDTVLVYLGSMADLHPGVNQLSPFTLSLIALGMALQFVPAGTAPRLARALALWPEWALGAVSGVGLVAINALGPDGVAPFIYFQF
jgi:alginate O-acetyltransferase complex protein AlgI